MNEDENDFNTNFIGGGNVNDGIEPNMLISLTAPKPCARHFKGEFHYVGGRFIPPAFAKKFGFELSIFPGTAQCVRIPRA